MVWLWQQADLASRHGLDLARISRVYSAPTVPRNQTSANCHRRTRPREPIYGHITNLGAFYIHAAQHFEKYYDTLTPSIGYWVELK